MNEFNPFSAKPGSPLIEGIFKDSESSFDGCVLLSRYEIIVWDEFFESELFCRSIP